jgi:phage head maturation protease
VNAAWSTNIDDDERRLDAMPETETLEPLAPCICHGAPDGAVSCLRVGCLRGDENGPRAFTEPCSRDELHVDAGESVRVIVATPETEWKRGKVKRWSLARFERNPIVLFDHRDDQLPIGRAHDLHLDAGAGGVLSASITFASHERAQEIKRAVLEGTLRGCSPHFTHHPDGTAELLDISITPLPKGARSLVVPATRRDAAPLSTLAGVLGPINPYSRSVQIVASTTNPVDGVALTSWDLERFKKNPVILWAHDADSIPIGTATDVAFSPEAGLTMTVLFGSEIANPDAERVLQAVLGGLLRGVSVGFDMHGDVAELVEVSFVPIPADEDALIDDEEEETMTMKEHADANDPVTLAREARDARAATAYLTPNEYRTDSAHLDAGRGIKRSIRAMCPDETITKPEMKDLRAYLGPAAAVATRGFLRRALAHVRSVRSAASTTRAIPSGDEEETTAKDQERERAEGNRSRSVRTDASPIEDDIVSRARAKRDEVAANAWKGGQ